MWKILDKKSRQSCYSGKKSSSFSWLWSIQCELVLSFRGKNCKCKLCIVPIICNIFYPGNQLWRVSTIQGTNKLQRLGFLWSELAQLVWGQLNYRIYIRRFKISYFNQAQINWKLCKAAFRFFTYLTLFDFLWNSISSYILYHFS